MRHPSYADTRDALLSESLTLHYQPIVCLKSQQLLGYEALARWGKVSPPTIAAIVEGHSLEALWLERQIEQINWMLGQLPEHLYISLNLGQRALNLSRLAAMLGDGPEPNRIVVEVLEAVRLTDQTAEALIQLKTRHILRADDIGSLDHGWIDRLVGGHAELFDGIKICKGLTYDVHHNKRTALLCAALLTIAQELDLATVAEWVHSREQMQWLLEHGCDGGQGALFGLAMPAHEVLGKVC